MSGGSWNYTYSQIMYAGEDLISGNECRDYNDDDSDEPRLNKHDLRIALGVYMLELAAVLKAIEWSDSGDRAEDAWVDPVTQFLQQRPTEIIMNAKQPEDVRQRLRNVLVDMPDKAIR